MLKQKKNNRHKLRIIGLSLSFIMILFFVSGCQKEPDFKSESQTPTQIHFIDTGNSDAICIVQGEHAALIDGGDNDDESLIVSYLSQIGIHHLDYVIATHPDADHIGGLDAVMNDLEVDQVLVGNGQASSKTYTDFIEAVMKKGLTPSVPLLHATFELGEGQLKVVSVANEKDVNNCSLVLLYSEGDYKVLFMGDADQSIEESIDLSEVREVNILKVGHHGSRTASNPKFIEAVSPEYAVITCGEGNKYGHPHQETLDTLENLHIPVYRTDYQGTLIFSLKQEGIQINDTLDEGSTNVITEENAPISEQTIEKVYFTENGKYYHKNPMCSNMKEPIEGTVDDVGMRKPCKKCYPAEE